METEARELLDALKSAIARFKARALQIRDPDARVRGSTWTAADLVAHVSTGVDAYAKYLEGDRDAWVDIGDLAGGSLTASNAANLAEDTERDISVLVDRLETCGARLVALAQDRSLDEIVSWHGSPQPLRCHLGSALAEVLLHGHDLARSNDAPWPISKREAALVLENIAPLMPVLVNAEATRDVAASIRVKLRGSITIPLDFDHGTLTLDGDRKRFDATISADPLSFLLVAYGRHNQWQEIARGGLVAWGLRPWYALKLTTYLVKP